VTIVGTAPLVMHRFDKKALTMTHEGHEAGGTAKKGKKREAKDFRAPA
jgi:hypothetical protein